MRPHFGHFTIHWSRSSFPVLIPPPIAGPMLPRTRRKTSPCYLNMVRSRRFRVTPRREFPRHLYREIEVVEGDLFDVDSERNRRPRLQRRRQQVGPERPSEFWRCSSERLLLRGRQRFLGPRRYGSAEPREELKVLVVGHRSEAQEDRCGLQALGGASLSVRAQDRRHRLGRE